MLPTDYFEWLICFLSWGFFRSGSVEGVWKSILALTWVTSFRRKRHTREARPWLTACGRQKSGWTNTKKCITIAALMLVWYAYLCGLLHNSAFVCLSACFQRTRLSHCLSYIALVEDAHFLCTNLDVSSPTFTESVEML